jgi:hypothetical protein
VALKKSIIFIPYLPNETSERASTEVSPRSWKSGDFLCADAELRKATTNLITPAASVV